MYHPLSRKHLYAACRIKPVFEDCGVEKSSQATGFFTTSTSDRLYLISNRHVFDARYSDIRKAGWSLKRVEIYGYHDSDLTPFSISITSPTITFPENSYEDVAALLITGQPFSGDISGSVIHVDASLFCAPEDFDRVEISDVVAFPVYHGASDQPVMRSGWIASDPSRDFVGHVAGDARRVAIDGFSWGGYSGSPVFTLSRGIQVGEGLKGGNFRESKLIGINAGHIKVSDGTGAHAGLSYLIKSSVLSDFLA